MRTPKQKGVLSSGAYPSLWYVSIIFLPLRGMAGFEGAPAAELAPAVSQADTFLENGESLKLAGNECFKKRGFSASLAGRHNIFPAPFVREKKCSTPDTPKT